ncbi:MAG: hypothetical protein QOG59_3675 [Solirubrobacteraceae bacterium]|nr:hypothetical protein [Solirubrobacteraceae bacterium]
MSPRRVGWLVLLALAGTGCAPLAPGPSATPSPPAAPRTTPAPGAAGSSAGRSAPTAARTPLAIAQATHEYPSSPVGQTPSAPAADPVRAVEAFAVAYINWDASTVAKDMSRLAARSVGQARSAMQLAAAQTAQDYELARAGVGNQGSVEAIGPVAGHPGQYAVVTLERTTATDSTAYAGLGAAWHVAIATVTRVAPGRWALSGWQPEN